MIDLIDNPWKRSRDRTYTTRGKAIDSGALGLGTAWAWIDAELPAGARFAIEFSRQYGEQRVVFGKPLIKRELWQHKFVNMYTKVEMAQAFVDKCVDAYNTDKYEKQGNVSMETVKLISMAKIVAGELVAEVMDTCLQFHGGWGYVEEYPIARAWRDARLLKIGGGTTETMTYYLAKLMGL